jgi:DNA polymerase V
MSLALLESTHVTLPLYTSKVSCGLFGIADDFSDNYLSLDAKYLVNKEATFLVRTSGDSMTPEIKAGDILIVDRSVELISGKVATFHLNGHAICKQFIKKSNGEIVLKSFNPSYQDIVISETDDLVLFGVVIGIARDY